MGHQQEATMQYSDQHPQKYSSGEYELESTRKNYKVAMMLH